MLHGESGSVDRVALEENRRELQNLIEQYAPEDIYNFDETGLFYRMKRWPLRVCVEKRKIKLAFRLVYAVTWMARRSLNQ